MPDFISDFSWGLFTLNLGLEDNAAGEIFYLFSLDSLEPENDDQHWQVYTGDNLTFSLADSNEGAQTLYLWLRDSAGNRAEVISLESYVDRTPPTFDKELQINSGALSSSSPDVSLSWDVSDNGSGLDSFTSVKQKNSQQKRINGFPFLPTPKVILTPLQILQRG